MPAVSVRYRFTVRLPAPPAAAYRWATDFRPDDLARMGEVGTRRVDRLAPDALVLTDTTRRGRGKVTKSRLVRLLPEELSWTNTHIGGPFLHSQFLYRLEPSGRGASRLTFTGLQLEHPSRRPTPAAMRARAREVARADAAAWRRLARAMAQELGPRARR